MECHCVSSLAGPPSWSFLATRPGRGGADAGLFGAGMFHVEQATRSAHRCGPRRLRPMAGGTFRRCPDGGARIQESRSTMRMPSGGVRQSHASLVGVPRGTPGPGSVLGVVPCLGSCRQIANGMPPTKADADGSRIRSAGRPCQAPRATGGPVRRAWQWIQYRESMCLAGVPRCAAVAPPARAARGVRSHPADGGIGYPAGIRLERPAVDRPP